MTLLTPSHDVFQALAGENMTTLCNVTPHLRIGLGNVTTLEIENVVPTFSPTIQKGQHFATLCYAKMPLIETSQTL
jgi:hypothetical protein